MLNRRLVFLLLPLVLVAAACGDSDAEPGTNAPDATDAPVAAAACAVGVADCVDTLIAGTDDEPTVTDGGGAVAPVAVDGGLTIPEALATEATGTIAVRGYLFDDEIGWRLCEVLAESFPPQCGGAALPLGNFDEATVDSLPEDENITIEENQGITWSDGYMTFFGEIVDGTLMIDVGAAS